MSLIIASEGKDIFYPLFFAFLWEYFQSYNFEKPVDCLSFSENWFSCVFDMALLFLCTLEPAWIMHEVRLGAQQARQDYKARLESSWPWTLRLEWWYSVLLRSSCNDLPVIKDQENLVPKCELSKFAITPFLFSEFVAACNRSYQASVC